jgi:hypothetical protein
MGTGAPLIFQIVLLLVLPMAVACHISVTGLVLVFLRVSLKNLSRRPRRGQIDFPFVPG